VARTLTEDPYKNYRFRVYFGEDKTPVAGMSNVSGLSKTVEEIPFKTGVGGVYTMPGMVGFGPVTLTKGITRHDSFHQWARSLGSDGDGAKGYDSEADLDISVRKDVKIALYNDTGKEAAAYRLSNCWVSEYQPLPDLNSGDNAVAVQTLTLQHEGFEKVE
jgi:phage tail-like protein